MKFAMILPFASMILGISARAIGAQQVKLGLTDLTVTNSESLDPKCVDTCLDVYLHCSSCKPSLANLLGKMTPDGCKMLFVKCMRDCDSEPIVPFEQTVRATDEACVLICDEHLETCDISTASFG